MIENDTVRNERVLKFCSYCGCEFISDKNDGERFCEEHRMEEQ